MQLRDYQEEAVESVFDYFKSGKKGNPNIALPTGTGKSLVIAGFAQRALQRHPSTRLMVLTDSKELVKQDHAKLMELWPQAPVGVYSAGLRRRDTHFRITFAGIDSVAKKPHIFGKQDLVLIDESQMVDWSKPDSRYRYFLSELRKVNPKIKGIGLTATPWRHGIGDIEDGGFFTDRCYSKIGVEDFHEFVEKKYLAPLYPMRTSTVIDTSNVGKVAGDFNMDQLQAASDREEITRAAIKESVEMAGDRKHWLVFCSGTAHVDHTVQYLREAGISAMGVHSKQSDTANDLAIKMYQDGHIQALVNMGVLTKGFDAPETDYIMMLRATMSAVLWVQMLGRGTRPAPWAGKMDCLVGDFAGNTKRLGPINDPLLPRKKGQKGGGTAPVKTCEVCGMHNHTMAKVCLKCGSDFPPPKTKLTYVAAGEELMKAPDDGMPDVQIFRVEYVTYNEHVKPGKPAMMRPTYECGFRMFNEYVCLEHEGYARVKAWQWWRKRFGKDSTPPTTVAEALEASPLFPVPTHIRVWVNKKYPEVMDVCFDGTAFGTIVAGSDDPNAVVAPEINLFNTPYRAMTDDDIPF